MHQDRQQSNATSRAGRLNGVAVWYGSEADPAVRAVVRALQPFAGLGPASRVVIKPNIVLSRKQWVGANTQPAVVEALIRLLHEHGVRNITVADGSGMGESATRAFSICGYTEIARRHGVKLLDIERGQFVEVPTRSDGPFSSLSLSRTVAECDFLINVPVLKAHCQTRITCSLKNLKGVLTSGLKSAFHGRDLERAIAQLGEVVAPDFILVDGTYGDLSSELGGNPVNIGIVAGGYDPLQIDCFAAQTLGYRPGEIKHLAHYARVRGVDIDALRPVITELNRPKAAHTFETSVRGHESYRCDVSVGNTCSTCYANLLFALQRMSSLRLLDRNDRIWIGRKPPLKDGGGKGRRIMVGDCAIGDFAPGPGRSDEVGAGPFDAAGRDAVRVPGCPPSADAVVRAVREASV